MDSEIKFEREGLEGVIAVGTYLSDAAFRFGIKDINKCDQTLQQHNCTVSILTGADTLSERTEVENKLVESGKLNSGERLACQTRIVTSGEVIVMTKEEVKPEEAAKEENSTSAEDYRKNFAEMPLEKMIADLVRLEAITFNETLSFIFNSPYHIGGKVMDVLAEFGFKKDAADKASVRPAEHVAAEGKDTETEAAAETVDDVVEAEFVDNEGLH